MGIVCEGSSESGVKEREDDVNEVRVSGQLIGQ